MTGLARRSVGSRWRRIGCRTREGRQRPGHIRAEGAERPGRMRQTKTMRRQAGNEVKMLVVIASYGSANDRYLLRVLAEYRSMPYATDIVVLSNAPKDLGSNVTVIVGLPNKHPWSLPFGHKRIFADRVNDYDLFVYSEDDMLVTERNIEAFRQATTVLEDDEIAGFLRF